MNVAASDALPVLNDSPSLRRSLYAVLIVVGAAAVVGRILAVDAVDSRRLEGYLYSQGRKDWQRRTPFLSANDRSRWCTIRALVEKRTYAIDEIINERNWDTIDAVKHDGRGNAAPEPHEGRVYSSKPPLLPTLLAGEYWLIYRFTPYSLGANPYLVARFMLITINVPLLVVMWWLIARHVERYGRTDWGRVFVMAAAVFGTLLTTFAVSLTNHLVAATAAMIAFDGGVRIVAEGDRRLLRFAQVGFFAAFAAANELPALALFACAGAALLWKYPRSTLVAFSPPALLVAGAFFGTNYAAHGTLTPAYGQREEGNNWYVYQYVRNGRVRNSYWTPGSERGPMDQGEPSAATYALHSLIGHHGIFSLTPIWLLTIFGLAKTLRTRGDALRPLAGVIALVSLVCIVFYLARPEIDRNYGGHSSGFRWAFWFAPLWLVTMLPAVDAKAACRWCRGFYLLLLALSVMSVTYPTWNPWTLPWLTDWLNHLGWIELDG
jgi:hypothetical protein